MRARRVGLLCLSLVLSGVAAVTSGTAATATTTIHRDSTELQLHGFTDIVADAKHGQEFISGDYSDDAVVVADQDGNFVRKLGGLRGASGLALSPDSSTVYVALNEAHAIAAIDTSTYAVRVLPVADDSCPQQLAIAAGLIWYHQDCGEDPEGGTIDAMQPQSAAVHRDVFRGGRVTDVLATPARPSTLVLAQGGITVLHVTGGDDPKASVTGTSGEDTELDLAMSANGERLITYRGVVLDTDTLRQVDHLPASADGHGFNKSVATRGDGAVAFANDPISGRQLQIYPHGQTVWPHQDSLFVGDQGPTSALQPHDMAFGATRLFVVTTDSPSGARLFVVDDDLTPHVPTGTHLVPLIGFDRVVADPPTGRAFVSGGWFDNGVAVLDSQARVIKVLQHLAGPTAMVRQPGGHTVYVALNGENAVAAIDTRTLRVRKLPLGDACPSSLAWAAGLLWFNSTCTVGRFLNSGTLDPKSGRVHRRLGNIGSREIFTDPARPNTLYLDDDPGRLAVTGGSHPTARPRPGKTLPWGTLDFAAAPDGLTLLGTTYSTNYRVAQSAANLSVTGLVADYVGQPDALAIRSDGLTATGRRYPTGSGAGITVASRPHDVPWLRINDPDDVLQRGLTFGQRNLFVAIGRNDGTRVVVRRMPPVRPVKISQDRSAYVSGQRATLVGHLTSPGVRRTMRIYATPYGAKHRTLIKNGRSDRFGNLRATYKPRITTRFTVVAPRSGRHKAVSDSMTISPGVRMKDRFDDGSKSGHVALHTQVFPAHAGQCLYFRIGAGRSVIHSSCRRLDRHGRASYQVHDLPPGSDGPVSIQAQWRGDRRNSATDGPKHIVALGQ